MKKMRLLAFLVTACLATTCFLSGTVAKYSSTATGSDTARVAKWSFKVGETNAENPADIAKTDVMTFNFDLFNTICDDGAVTTTTETDDANVSDATATTAAEKMIIAPGTSGWFEIELNNASEVTAKYTITFEVTDNGVTSGNETVKIPLQYKVVDTSDDSTATSTAEWKNAPETFTCALIEANGTDKVTVYWKWDFETTDENGQNTSDVNDTILGTANKLPELKVTATITAEQVD